MKILYLDQNEWIELARAQKAPDDYPEQHAVLATLVAEANAGRLVVPLTQTNQYETQKIVAENMFSNLAIQAGLHKKFGTHIKTRLSDLPAVLNAE